MRGFQRTSGLRDGAQAERGQVAIAGQGLGLDDGRCVTDAPGGHGLGQAAVARRRARSGAVDARVPDPASLPPIVQGRASTCAAEGSTRDAGSSW
jgi:hypothetical protein